VGCGYVEVGGMKQIDGYETLYRKVGRQYVAVGTARDMYRSYENVLYAGQWRMEYCPRDGRGRYWYDVRPDTASWSAAAMLAEDAMIEAIDKARFAHPSFGVGVKMTRRQQKAVADARAILADAGLLDPHWWTHRSAGEIAKAGIDAVREFSA
jgi:hypothetical protein